MKRGIYVAIVFFSTLSLGNAADENVKTGQESRDFEKEVEKEVLKRIEQIKKKSVVEMTKSLIQKQQELERQQKKLDESKEQIQKASSALEQKIKAFEAKQKKVIGCIKDNQNKSEQRVSQIVTVISNMKPDKAAQLLSVQDADISVSILAEIDPKRASKIFNIMDKEISARLQKQYLNMKK